MKTKIQFNTEMLHAGTTYILINTETNDYKISDDFDELMKEIYNERNQPEYLVHSKTKHNLILGYISILTENQIKEVTHQTIIIKRHNGKTKYTNDIDEKRLSYRFANGYWLNPNPKYLKCPNCGKIPNMTYQSNKNIITGYAVRCTNGCFCQTNIQTSEQNAIIAWINGEIHANTIADKEIAKWLVLKDNTAKQKHHIYYIGENEKYDKMDLEEILIEAGYEKDEINEIKEKTYTKPTSEDIAEIFDNTMEDRHHNWLKNMFTTLQKSIKENILSKTDPIDTDITNVLRDVINNILS